MHPRTHARALQKGGKPGLGECREEHFVVKLKKKTPAFVIVPGEEQEVNEIQVSHCLDQGRLPLVSNYSTNLLVINKARPNASLSNGQQQHPQHTPPTGGTEAVSLAF